MTCWSACVAVERVQAAPGLASRLRPVSAADVEGTVRQIVERVRAEGDEAVLELTRALDTEGSQPWPLRVDPLQLTEALDALPQPLREALELAAANVRAVSLAGLGSE